MVFIVNLIRHDFPLWELFHLWKFPTISNDCECKGAAAVGSRRRSTFPYMLVVFILGNNLCNSKISCFQIHFVNFYRSRKELQWKGACGWELLNVTTQRFYLTLLLNVRQGGRMAAIMLQTIPSFYAKISEKSLFISAKT